jgi:hypothetical protein
MRPQVLPHSEGEVRILRISQSQDEEMSDTAQHSIHAAAHHAAAALSACCSAAASVADNWGEKALRRRTNGTGRMRYMRTLSRRFKNGFRENTRPTAKKAASRKQPQQA